MKYLFMTAVLLFPALTYAGGMYWGSIGQGMSDGMAANRQAAAQAQQQQINAQWMEMSKAWTNCMNQGGGASCGQPPAQPYQQPQQQYQQPQQRYQPPPPQPAYDFNCVTACTNKGYTYSLCLNQCRTN